MKKNLIVLISVIALFIMLSSFQDRNQFQIVPAAPGDKFIIPEDISSIFDKSCFGCHNVDAESDKSKKKLLIDKLGDLSKAKLVAKLGEISEVVEQNEMPPEKFLAKYPDKALTKEEAQRLKEWADDVVEGLLK